MSLAKTVENMAKKARAAAGPLAKAATAQKNEALKAIAAGLRKEAPAILKANARDMAAAKKSKMAPAMLDRLMLDEKRVEGMARAVEDVVKLADPVGKVLEESERPNGLKLSRVRVPLGVVGIVYESRPNVTVDAAVLCLKAGNVTMLRGGSESVNSNVALGKVIQSGLKAASTLR